jgi:hypothetical protein
MKLFYLNAAQKSVVMQLKNAKDLNNKSFTNVNLITKLLLLNFSIKMQFLWGGVTT